MNRGRLVGRLLPGFLLLCANFSVHAEHPLDALIRANDVAGVQAAISHEPSLVSQRLDSGITPLMQAAYLERPELVALLRENTPALDFFEACIVGDLAAVRSRLARGTDVNAYSPDGFPPLGLAVFFRQHDIARLLLDAGANVNARSSNALGVAPLHGAVARADLVSIELLLLRGADPDQPQQRLLRPLHEAAASGSLPIVAMLLLLGADPAALSEDGRTPADFARSAGHPELATRLELAARRSGTP